MANILKVFFPCFWIALAVVMGIVETLTWGLTTCWFVFGALFALLSVYFGAAWRLQIIIFLIMSIGMLIFFRPLAKNYFKIGATQTGAFSLIKQIGLVQEGINPPLNGVVIVQGQVWTAEAEEVIAEGTKVEIKGINGAVLKVQKL